MSFFKLDRKVAVAEPAATVKRVSIERPGPEMPLIVADDTYQQEAQKLGLENHAVLVNWLMREEIPIYDVDRVERFMNSMVEPYTKANGVPSEGQLMWRWHPLRQFDTGEHKGAWWQNGHFGDRVYEKPIPLVVLKLASQIRERFPDACFYVADTYQYKRALETRGDPFLGVQAVKFSRLAVVAVWDEPGF